jgi:hypothetical protein
MDASSVERLTRLQLRDGRVFGGETRLCWMVALDTFLVSCGARQQAGVMPNLKVMRRIPEGSRQPPRVNLRVPTSASSSPSGHNLIHHLRASTLSYLHHPVKFSIRTQSHHHLRASTPNPRRAIYTTPVVQDCPRAHRAEKIGIRSKE